MLALDQLIDGIADVLWAEVSAPSCQRSAPPTEWQVAMRGKPIAASEPMCESGSPDGAKTSFFSLHNDYRKGMPRNLCNS